MVISQIQCSPNQGLLATIEAMSKGANKFMEKFPTNTKAAKVRRQSEHCKPPPAQLECSPKKEPDVMRVGDA